MQDINKLSISTIKQGKELQYQQTPVLSYHVAYPHFTGGVRPQAVMQMNRYYEMMARSFAAYCQKTLFSNAVSDYHSSVKNSYPIHEYQAELAYTATYNQDDRVSLYTDRYEYTGGAHGTTTRSSDTWDMRRGRRLTLAQVLPQSKDLSKRIQAHVIAQIRSQLATGAGQYFDNYEALVGQTFRPNQFYLTPEGIAVYFQQYDIAPYSSGIPVFVIPFEELKQ